jgi:hypothetical protein
MNLDELKKLNQFLEADINDNNLQLDVISKEIEDHEKNREMIITAIQAVS